MRNEPIRQAMQTVHIMPIAFVMRIVIVMGFSSKNLFPLPQLSNLSGIFVEHIKKIPPFYHNVACFSSYCSTILDRTPYILIIEEKI